MGEHEEEVVDYFGKGPADGAEKTADALAVQSIDDLRDLSALTPLTPQIISRQATINIGTIGHVAHGKSTLVRAISGVKTVRFKRELVQNITIKLGYGNAKLFRCSRAPPPPAAGDADAPPPVPAPPLDAGAKPEPVGEFCLPPGCYAAMGSGARDDPPCPSCGAPMRLVRHVSFVDCPGHDILMATMLNGAAVMDAALLLVAGNEECPQPQTLEHLRAVEIMRLKHVLIVQNKIDLVREAHALKQYAEIKKCVHGTVAHDAPIIPVSAQLRYNIDVVVEYLCDRVPVPLRDFTSPPRLVVIRSFDVNRPGGEVAQLRGGVAGGTIACGVLRVGDEIEVRPGIYKKEGGHARCYPLVSTVKSLKAEDNALVYAVPGGLIGVGTALDPTLTRADRLVGQVLGRRGQLPGVFVEIEVAVYLLQRLLGVRADAAGAGALRSATVRVPPLARDEVLMVNIGSMSAGGRVVAVQLDRAKLSLTVPVCCDVGEKCALSRRVDKHWRLIGWGKIQRGVPLPDLPSIPPPPILSSPSEAAPGVPGPAATV